MRGVQSSRAPRDLSARRDRAADSQSPLGSPARRQPGPSPSSH